MGIPFPRLKWSSPSNNPAIRYGALLRLALPSILLQSGAPIAITVQTALLGHKATELVAAWAVVATATNAATVVFNFLVVGVTAKVSKVVGARAWKQVGSRIRLALASAVCMGILAALFLWALQEPIFLLLQAAPEVVVPAQEYFTLRVLGVPSQLLAMCTSGILQGYKRVNLVASIQIIRLCLDVFLSYVALYVFDFGIRGVGAGNLLASSVSAVTALCCILAFPPEAGQGSIHIFPNLRELARNHLRRSFRMGPLRQALTPLLQDELAAQLAAEEGRRSRAQASERRGFLSGWLGKWQQDPRKAGDVAEGEALQVAGSEAPLAEWGKEEGHRSLPDQSMGNRHVATGKQGEPWVKGEAEENEEGADVEGVKESFWKFVWDGLSTMLRSALVQASFFMVLASVTALGTHAVAAHQVVMQLWMVTVYFADGFATAGTIVGSELTGQIDRAETREKHEAALADLRVMSRRVLTMGTGVGVAVGTSYWLFERSIVDIFTYDPLTKAELKAVWAFLIFIQPLNAIVFVYDGLIYAAQAFSYMATCLSVGFVLLFLPSIALAKYRFHTLLSAWAAKGVLNVVRLAVASYKIHFDFLAPPPPKAPLTEVLSPTSEPEQVSVVKVGTGMDSRDFASKDWLSFQPKANAISLGGDEGLVTRKDSEESSPPLN